MSPPAALAFQRGAVSPAGAVTAGVVCLVTLGCSLRFGVVLLAAGYSCHKLRQLREARGVLACEPPMLRAETGPQEGMMTDDTHRPAGWLEVCVGGGWNGVEW